MYSEFKMNKSVSIEYAENVIQLKRLELLTEIQNHLGMAIGSTQSFEEILVGLDKKQESMRKNMLQKMQDKQ